MVIGDLDLEKYGFSELPHQKMGVTEKGIKMRNTKLTPRHPGQISSVWSEVPVATLTSALAANQSGIPYQS